jgi:Ca-activated chloride channel family protein
LSWAKLLLLGIVMAISSGQASFAQTAEPTEIIRVDSDLVDLKVSVVRLNPENAVSDLQQKDFLVLEDGKPQEIVFFAGEDAPFDLVLLLDLSGSTADKLKLIRNSAKRFVENTRPMDRVAILTFTDVAQIVSPLTLDRAVLKKEIKKIEKPVGGTNFWDSLLFTMESVLPAQKASRRSAIVVMTDGVDNSLPDVFGEGSRTSFAELLDKVTRSDIIVFPIYLDTEDQVVKRNRVPRNAYAIARSQLAQLAQSCGTRVYQASKLKDLDQVYGQVIKDLAMVYSVGYKPSNTLRDGKWRSVAVQLIGHQDLSARTKRGYYAKLN